MKNLFIKENKRQGRFEKNHVLRSTFSAVLLILAIVGTVAYGQAPNISYTSPQVYHPFVPKAPIPPKNNGGVIPGANPVTLGSLDINITGIAADTAGNVYVVGANSTSVTELKDNTFITLGSTLLNPTGIAVDPAGNIFIADNGHGVVKEIPAGSKNVVNYLFSVTNATGIAVDAHDNIYISKLNSIVEFPVGTKTQKTVGGGDNVAITVDSAGNVYWCDIAEQELFERVVSKGENIVLASGLSALNSIATDGHGNIYYSQGGSTITEIPTGGGPAFAITTGLSTAGYMAVAKKGDIFVESGGNSIQKIPFGIYSVTPALPPGLTFNHKTGAIGGTPLTVTPAANYSVTGYNSNGSSTATINIAVTAAAKPVIKYDTPQTFYINKAGSISPISSGGAVPTQHPVKLAVPTLPNFSLRGLALDGGGNIYTAFLNSDPLAGNDFVEKIPPGGGPPVHIGSGFNQPIDIAVDGTGNVFVTDADHVVKEILASNGNTVTYATGFTVPEGLAVDSAGDLYVSDHSKNAIFKVPAGGGTPVQLIGGLNLPTGVAIDAAGNIYIANTGGNNVKELPVGGSTLITLATNFNSPFGVAVDNAGNVFVADEGEAAVKRIPAGGGTAVPILTSIKFKEPGAIRLDKSNNIYVGDWSAEAVYEVNPGYFVNPDLPNGLSIDESTGTISGTPTAKKAAANYTITAYNSGGTGKATLNLKVVSGTNTSLSGLTISSGSFVPVYNPATTSYNVSVNNAVTSITFTPTTSDTTAVVTINGSIVASGSASPAITLAEGLNTIHILVDDNSGTTEANYTINITRGTATNANLQTLKVSRGAISPTFNINTTSYTDNVVNGVTSMTVTPTTSIAGATITVNGVAVTSGAASDPISLNVGSNTITFVVTATDGTTTKTYTLTVNRAGAVNDLLSTLKVSRGALSPAFNPKTGGYAVNVVNGVLSIQLTPTSQVGTSTITVNGAMVASGETSNPIALGVGTNTITIVVIAQDGVTKKSYVVTVTRATGAESDDAFAPDISVTKPNETPTLNDDVIFVHQGVSPNGDGVNDFLQIDGIQAFPNNKLAIMNRNGQLIYEASGYDNATKTFDGHSNKNGQLQLPGTYFYQLDYMVKGIVKHKTGFLVLKY